MHEVSLRRGAVTLTAASMLDFALQLLLPVALVRLLPAPAFADYRLAWLAIGTAMAVAPLALPRSLFYFLPRTAEQQRPAFVHNTLLMLLASGVCAGLLLGPWNTLLPASLRHIAGAAWFLPAFLSVWVAASLAEFLPSARGDPGRQALLIVALAVLRVAVVSLAAVSGRADVVFAALLAYAAVKLALVLVDVGRHYRAFPDGTAVQRPRSPDSAAEPRRPAASAEAAQAGRPGSSEHAAAAFARDTVDGAIGSKHCTAHCAEHCDEHCTAHCAEHCTKHCTEHCAESAQAARAPDSPCPHAPSRWCLLRTQLAYALPFGLGSALFLLRGQADQWVAASLFSAAAFAAFSIGAVIMPLVALVRTSIANAISARLSSLESQRDRAAMLRLNQRANLAAALVLLPGLALTAVLAGHIVTLVYTPAFLAAADVMRINCLALVGVAVEVSTLTMVLNQGRFLLAADAVLLPAGVAAAALGATLWGLPGAACGNILTLAAGNAFSFWRVARATGVPLARLQRWPVLLRMLVAAATAALPAVLFDRAALVHAALPEALLAAVLYGLAYLLMLRLLGLLPLARELFGWARPAFSSGARP